MKRIILFFAFVAFFESSFACSCSKRPDEFYDFIALVVICNNEPDPSDDFRRIYQSEFEIIELYKGPELTHVVGFGSIEFASEAACEELYESGEEWILFSKYSPEMNNFITSYCSHNFKHRSKEGMRNWVRSNPNQKINLYNEKYLKQEPRPFMGDTLKEFYPNGNLERISSYQNGKLHGATKVFFPSGNLYKDLNYKQGNLHGESKTFYYKVAFPQLANYKNGRRHGLWLWHFRDGTVREKRIYSHNQVGFLEKESRGMMPGKLQEVYDFSTCTKIRKEWSENGVLESQHISYHNHDSESWTFDLNGNIKSWRKWYAKERYTSKADF